MHSITSFENHTCKRDIDIYGNYLYVSRIRDSNDPLCDCHYNDPNGDLNDDMDHFG